MMSLPDIITPNGVVIATLIALLIVLLIGRTLSRWNKADEIDFSFLDLITENGRASKGAIVLLGAFVATTFVFVYYALTGRMTEGYFGLYGAMWVTPVVARMITNQPQPPKENPDVNN